MPDFAYAAVDRQGKTFRGNLEESDQSRAIQRLKEMGLFPTQVNPRLAFADLGNGQPLPSFTLFVLGLSQTIRIHALGLVGFAITGVLAVKFACRYPGIRLRADQVKLGLPIFGKLYHLVALTRFCRTLSTLLQSGVPVLQALNIVRETTGNCVLGRAVDQIHNAVKEGEAFTPIMDAVPIFPATLVTMVDVGEQTGALPDMLAKAADNYDERVDNTVTGLTALIEPIMIIFLAVIVGSIVIAMFLPLIRIIQVGFDDPARAG